MQVNRDAFPQKSQREEKEKGERENTFPQQIKINYYSIEGISSNTIILKINIHPQVTQSRPEQ